MIALGALLRIIFLARPADETPPKRAPDGESLGAGWFTLEEIRGMPLRSPEVYRLFEHVANGGAVYPMSLLSFEGMPFGE